MEGETQLDAGDGASVISRRALIAGAAAAGAALLVPTVFVLRRSERDGGPIAFEFRHDPDVDVIFEEAPDPYRYNIRLRRGRETLELFEDVNPYHLEDLDSKHVQVRYVDPPA